MPIEANIIVHGHGGSQDINSSRGIGTANFVASHTKDTFSRIIFTGGRTYGPNNPSEARGMLQAFQEVKPLTDAEILLEEKAYDTFMNATESLRLIRGGVRDSVIFLLSSGWHLPRINKIYKELGVPHRVLVDTDDLVDEAMQKAIRSHPAYRIGILREPIVQLFEQRGLRKIKHFFTSRRIRS